MFPLNLQRGQSGNAIAIGLIELKAQNGMQLDTGTGIMLLTVEYFSRYDFFRSIELKVVCVLKFST